MTQPDSSAPRPTSKELLATSELLTLAKAGDARALDALMSRYLPRLRRWASGRLPMRARSLFDTGDLVQETLLKTFERLDRVEVRGPGGFQAYVRAAVLNRMRDEVRWADRRRGSEEVTEALEDHAPSPLDMAIGADVVARYEKALGTLDEEDRMLLHLRIELDYDLAEIATHTGRASKDAARMAVNRALKRLADAMGHVG